MDEREVFAELLRYFPEGEDKRMCSNMRAYSEACLVSGEFAEAENYADKLLAQDCGEECLISARKTKLFCKLQCRSNEEFRHCVHFTKDLPEYSELLMACAENEKKLSEFIMLAESNLQTVENDRVKREEAERKRTEEAKRAKKTEEERVERERLKRERAEERKIEEQKEQERLAEEKREAEESKKKFLEKLPLIAIGVCILVMLISFFAGAIEVAGGAFIALIFIVLLIYSG